MLPIFFSIALLLTSLTPQEQANFGVSFAEQGKSKAAKPLLEKALASKKLGKAENARVRAALALVYLQKNNLEKAIEELELSVQMAPKVERPVLLLGMAYLLSDQPEKAKQTYLNSLKEQPNSAEISHDLGLLLFQDQLFKEALPWLEKAAKLKKKDPNFLIDYAYVLNQLGRAKQAKNVAISALNIAPENTNILYTLATTHIALNEEKEAKRVYQAALDSDPMHIPSLYHLGLINSKEHDFKNAAKSFIQILKIDPSHQKSRLYLAKAWAQIGKEQRAIKLLEKSLEKYPDSELKTNYQKVLQILRKKFPKKTPKKAVK